MPAKSATQPAFTELVVRVVQESPEPLTFAEIMARVNALHPIDTNSPKSTIRNAIANTRLVVNNDAGAYGWYPRLMRGARVRLPFKPSDALSAKPKLALADDARELLWPGFFQTRLGYRDDAVNIALPNGAQCNCLLDMIGRGKWFAIASPELKRWLTTAKARAGDDLILEGTDPEKRQYHLSLDPASSRDNVAIGKRTRVVISAGTKHLLGRGREVFSDFEMARYLLSSGQLCHLVPPEPISRIWRTMFAQADQDTSRHKNIHKLKITLQDTNPPIWRRVCVPSHWTLGTLHYVMQVAMGWSNSHLHQFDAKQGGEMKHFSLYLDEDSGLKLLDSRKVRISKIAPKVGDRIVYEYDFGDGWVHTVDVEAVFPANPDALYPHCIAGERAGPPDDCGGLSGYEDLLKVLASRKHREHADA